jgi:hypothetical protein
MVVPLMFGAADCGEYRQAAGAPTQVLNYSVPASFWRQGYVRSAWHAAGGKQRHASLIQPLKVIHCVGDPREPRKLLNEFPHLVKFPQIARVIVVPGHG